jgi:ATP-binding cassette subfamily F protein 2
MPAKKKNNNKGKSNNNAKAAPKTVVVEVEEPVFSSRNATGVLTSREDSRDVKIEGFSLSFHGRELISDTTIELTHGRRYGLIGFNGSGKSTFLHTLAHREVPIPDSVDIYMLHEEAAPSDRTAIQAVIDEAEKEVKRLEKLEETVLAEDGPESPILTEIYERLDSLDASTFEKRAGELLFGLGFDTVFIQKKTKDLSGGWRMRVALAKALFVKPLLLLLDEPTNHLDLEACVWLENYLASYPHCLVIISHSQDFLNGVCTNIIHLHKNKLTYYGGNYDTYVKTRAELEQNQMKHYEKQQEDIAHIKSFIASCGTYSNLVRQAKSKQKIIDKMEAAGLVEKVVKDHVLSFYFPSCGKLSPPVLQFCNVGFAYSGKVSDLLYKNLEFGVDLDSRIALVGPNGAGKSTLLKLMAGELIPTQGEIKRHNQLQIARYYQHSAEQLPTDICPLDYLKREFASKDLEEEQWRSTLGRYGLTGSQQTNLIGTLSGGQKSRIVFCVIAIRSPHLLLLDEPTNHLDMECIDSLANAINNFEGGLVLVSHDFRLINQVAQSIWVCDKKKVTNWKGDIQSYKKSLQDAFHS